MRIIILLNSTFSHVRSVSLVRSVTPNGFGLFVRLEGAVSGPGNALIGSWHPLTIVPLTISIHRPISVYGEKDITSQTLWWICLYQRGAHAVYELRPKSRVVTRKGYKRKGGEESRSGCSERDFCPRSGSAMVPHIRHSNLGEERYSILYIEGFVLCPVLFSKSVL